MELSAFENDHAISTATKNINKNKNADREYAKAPDDANAVSAAERLRRFTEVMALIPVLARENAVLKEEMDALRRAADARDAETAEVRAAVEETARIQEEEIARRESLEPFPFSFARWLGILVRWVFGGVFGWHHYYRGDFGLAVMYATSWGLFGIGWVFDLFGVWLHRGDTRTGRFIRACFSLLYVNVQLFLVEWYYERHGGMPSVLVGASPLPLAEVKMFVVVFALALARELDFFVASVCVFLAAWQYHLGKHAAFESPTPETYAALRSFFVAMYFGVCFFFPASTKFVREPRKRSRRLELLMVLSALLLLLGFLDGTVPGVLFAYHSTHQRAFFWYTHARFNPNTASSHDNNETM